MVIQVREPRIDTVDLNDWSTFIARTTVQMGGFICLGLKGGSGGPPIIEAGSRFEMNGCLFKVMEDEPVQGSLLANAVNYVYAEPDGTDSAGDSLMKFVYSAETPEWKPALGGWYDSANSRRALIKYKPDSAANTKVIILNDFNSMYLYFGLAYIYVANQSGQVYGIQGGQ